MNIKTIIPCILLILAGFSFQDKVVAQDVSKVGTTASQFLRIPVGARASGMGGAIAADVKDASAMYWNPAGLADIKSNEIMVEYADWFLDINHNYVGIAIPTKTGVAGLHLIALTMGEFEETTFDLPEGTGRTFDAYMISAGVSYAAYLFPKFRLGGTVKFVHEKIFDTSASSFAFDIGTIYDLPFFGLRFGVSLTNFGPKMNLDGDGLILPVDVDRGSSGNFISDGKLRTDDFELPLMLRGGLAWDPYKNDRIRTTITVDGTSPNDNVQSVSVGGEIALLNELFVVRGGAPFLGLRDRVQEFNLGLGINYGFNDLNLRFGYAFESYQYLDSVNRISVHVLF
ncbi:MAG: PorV/PorQ family protein [Balneolaceae bacterium]